MSSLVVHRLIKMTDELYELQLAREGIAFQPGHCLALYNAEGESRPYSIASGTDESFFRFFIRRIPNGPVSRWLTSRRAGDSVLVSEPFGWFRPGDSEPDERCVFIATGTGIAPFLSYLRTKRSPPLACLYGVSSLGDAFALESLKQLPNFQLAVSKEKTVGNFYGRVTGLLETLPLEEGIHYYLCGLDDMIDEVSQWLERHGIDYSQIHREVFFYAQES
jgi:ferredoxin-NADP reductase